MYIIGRIKLTLTGVKPSKWQENLLKEALKESLLFINSKYEIDVTNLVTLRLSTPCRFAKYIHGKGIIRIDLQNSNVNLYKLKTLGEYSTFIKTGYKISYICQLIHELTHLIQDLDNRKYSEVETTKNEVEYLRMKKVIV